MAGRPTWAPGAARACAARVDRRVTGEQVCLRTTRWHSAMSEGELRTARGLARSGLVVGSHEGDSSSTAAGLVAVASANPGGYSRCEWPSFVSGRATRGDERHGGVGTPHSRGASGGMVIGSGADEVGTFSWRSCARRLVGSVTWRRGGSLAHHRPSRKDLGTGVTSQCVMGPPSQAGDLMPRRG